MNETLYVTPTIGVAPFGTIVRTMEAVRELGWTTLVFCNGRSVYGASVQEFGASVSYTTGQNEGYGQAANIAQSCCDPEWIIIANDDLTWTKEALETLDHELRASREDHPEVIIAGPTDMDIARLPGATGVVGRVSMLAGFGKVVRGLRAGPHPKGARVVLQEGMAAPFVCVAVNRSAWAKVGGFDKRFALYFEDLDFVARAHSLSIPMTVLRLPVVHEHSMSSAAYTERVTSVLAESAELYLQRHCGVRGRTAKSMVALGLVLRWLVSLVTRRSASSRRGVLAALAELRSSEPAMLPDWHEL